MLPRLSLLKKIAQDVDQPTAAGDATGVIPVKVDKNDRPDPKTQKWVDKFNPIDSKVVARFAFLGDRIKKIEAMDRAEKISHMRELATLREEWRQMSMKYNTISFSPETGTLIWGQSKEQEQFESSLLEKAGVQYPKYVNRGEYSKVYLGVFKGKTVVAKLTVSQADVDTANMIVNLRNSVPTEVSKHLLDILDIVTLDERETEGKIFYVILTEKLVHANPHVRDLLSNLDLDTQEETQEEGVKTKKRSVENLLRSTDSVFEEMVVNLLKKKVDMDKAIEGKILAPIVKETLKTLAEDAGNYDAITSARQKMRNLLDEKLDASPVVIDDMVKETIGLITRLSREVQMPLGTRDDIVKDKSPQFAALEAMPETKSFVRSIMYLKNMGLRSVDLNRKNIMERPGTHDLVLADIGTIKPDTNSST